MYLSELIVRAGVGRGQRFDPAPAASAAGPGQPLQPSGPRSSRADMPGASAAAAMEDIVIDVPIVMTMENLAQVSVSWR